MRSSPYNREILVMLDEAITQFVAGNSDLPQVQSVLSSVIGLLENDQTGADRLIRAAEADIEEVRFTRLLEEQRGAAATRLDRLRMELSEDV